MEEGNFNFQSCLDLLEEEQRGHDCITAGIPGVDKLLRGGLHTGDLIEISGSPGVGKTQLTIFTSICTLASNTSATVLYIDSSNSFSSTQFVKYYQKSDRFAEFRNSGISVESLLSRLSIVNLFDCYELINFLEKLPDNHQEHLHSLRLMVIDSIAGFIAPVIGIGTALKLQLKTDLKASMRASQKLETTVIRSILADITYAEKTPQGAPESLIDVIKKSVKKREEAITQFESAGRDELVLKEKSEIEIMTRYLPKQLSTAELEDLVKSVVSELGLSSPKETGKLVKAVKERVDAGSLDMKLLTETFKKVLQS
ncbi:hypothetical protein HK098_006199 [Nowakowskiella sp. JEL0407]|nr:hypothetical protein HK098_006199 [Nowakowskiella sp. JEL0407]